ncbi:ATP-dependent zinc metalloprotease FtsH [Agathobaculum hominis]|uniref:ATP-dependent zinc metalloprotease FtsH n=1 Tax=Agathobaculum hominis TaxID=2763014 RepID=A0ABR7GJA4_9FIRM|nr:ATP-dependent zinc metalloprotease FtsH [Agathobaculum hominis]MBC5694380.1 ATP-dependent metallopeptidase FtsH/Yme1/Tma family protein [Agathobaculum hominis]
MKGFGLYLLILVCLLAGVSYVVSQTQKTESISYSDVYSYFEQGDVDRYTLEGGTLTMHLKNENRAVSYEIGDYTSVWWAQLGSVIDQQMKDGTLTKVDYITTTIPWWAQFLPYLILVVLIGAFWYFMMNKQSGGGAGPMQFGKARAKLAQDGKNKVTFNDVAGADEEKAELQEIVEFLKNPQKFVQIGARIPKGVLLVGPPGTGKTLIAKAVAGEAGVPFLSISGSDFVELYVGVGASRVRDLFEQAKKNAPAIVFIDEIDAVGRQRGAGLGGGHDEREQTLNQLLVEMDGFGANEGVIVIAATNRKDILDNALLRPGRFDRQVYVGAPDVKGREAILKVHARNKQFDPDVKFSDIAKTTAGFTGADLENLLNEAALLAARRNKKLISQEEIEESLLKVVMGVEKKSHIITEHDKRLTAYHEAGHAICFEVLPTQDPVHHVTIIPRSSGAGGFTMPLPEEDQAYRTKKYMEEYIVVCLGGRVAEKLTMEDISTGAYGDIKQATQMARAMVTSYGMSDKIGPIDYGSEGGEIFLGRDFAAGKGYSEVKAAEIDDEIHRIIETAYHQCEKLLSEHMDAMTRVAEYLIRNETMDGETFKKVFNGEAVPDKVVGADLMSELQKDLNEKIGEPAKAESAEPEHSENK